MWARYPGPRATKSRGLVLLFLRLGGEGAAQPSPSAATMAKHGVSEHVPQRPAGGAEFLRVDRKSPRSHRSRPRPPLGLERLGRL